MASDLLARLDESLVSLPAAEQAISRQLGARLEREQLRYLMHRVLHSADEYLAHDPLMRGRASALNASEKLPVSTETGMTLSFAVDKFLKDRSQEGLGGNHLNELARALGWLTERFGGSCRLNAIT